MKITTAALVGLISFASTVSGDTFTRTNAIATATSNTGTGNNLVGFGQNTLGGFESIDSFASQNGVFTNFNGNGNGLTSTVTSNAGGVQSTTVRSTNSAQETIVVPINATASESGKDLNIRFNKIPLVNGFLPIEARVPLGARDYPLSLPTARWIRKTKAISVFHFDDCHECTIRPEALVRAAKVPPTHPNSNPNSPFWDDLREVIRLQVARRAGQSASNFLRLPTIWAGYSIAEVAEAVHDEYPGSIHARMIERLFGGPLDRTYGPNCPLCTQVDRTIIPSNSETEFIRGMIMLSDLNTWAFGAIGGMNFSVKWYVGRARPEEVVYAIYSDLITASDGVPSDVVSSIKGNFTLTDMRQFTAYPEGSPDHPSYPAMHSASSAASLWMVVVLDLTTAQWCEVKAVDYAISYARTVAGVHYPTDNIAGLNIGQEIMARKLPGHLVTKYGSNEQAVKEKIARVRFDWRNYLTSECFA